MFSQKKQKYGKVNSFRNNHEQKRLDENQNQALKSVTCTQRDVESSSSLGCYGIEIEEKTFHRG